MNADIVSINGKTFKPEDAKISVFDRGFLFGDAVYEVTRSYSRILFQLEEHVERLFRSAEQIQMDLVRTPQQTIDELYRVYKLVDKDDKYIRVQITRGEGAIGMGMNLARECNWVIFIKDIDRVAHEFYETGVKIVTTRRLRNSKKALDPNIKSGNYLNNVLAFREASLAKASECIMVDSRGFLAEGTTSNFFCVRKGVVQTSSDSSDILRGITRKLVFNLAKKNSIKIEEVDITPLELSEADEVFITSSTREILPVNQVDEKKIKSGGVGPVTKELLRLYRQEIASYCNWAKEKHPWG